MAELSDVPGAGLPPFENFYLNLYFKIGSAFTSDQSSLNRFQISTRDILRVVDENDLGVLGQQMLIPRLQGIEASSRDWSVLMTLAHLNQVNKDIMEVIRSLKSSSEPFQVVRIQDYKPSEDVGAEAIDQFREGNKRYWAFAKSHMPLRTDLTHRHPWFGELDGHGWHFLAAIHQKVHLRQIYKILAMIGVA